MTDPEPLATDAVLDCVLAALGLAQAQSGLPDPRIIAAHVTLRREGRQIARAWAEGPLPDCLTAAVRIARHATGESVSTVEVTLAHSPRPLNRDDLSRARCNDFRGLCGIALRTDVATLRTGPLEMLTRNLGPNRALELLSDGVTGKAQAEAFAANQYLVELTPRRCTALFRGQSIVPQSEITRETVAEMANTMAAWLGAQVGADGRTTYKYWPSNGEYSKSNNMIRQFMGSACLAVAASRFPHLAGARDRNFAHNFAAFYVQEPEFGYINEAGKVKLGAAAVALMAILALPDPGVHAQAAQHLEAFLAHMQTGTGAFRTFLVPAERTDCENFYPGEALLALAMLQARSPTEARQTRLMAGFRFYRDWHRAARNPAFVPWHTRAWCLLHRITGDPELADFVFEMNDWLLGIQAQPGCQPDVTGEFFDPARPEFGPPHASSTGVFLEGLIEAWHLAVSLSDRTRAQSYRRAILLGLRSLRQLQFRSPADAFYLRNKARVLGAVRSSSFDNTIRIDNVQHALMAIFRILDGFSETDYSV